MGGLPAEDLRTARLLLRAPAEHDLDDMVAAMRDPLVRRFLPFTPEPFGRAEANAWRDTETPGRWAAGGAAFAVADGTSDRLLGGVYLQHVSPRRTDAEIAYWLAPWARGHGVAAEAVSAVTDWALRRGMARLELLAAPDNPGSQRVALTAGYRREGVKRGGGSRPDGSRYDTVLWARLATDPPAPTPRLLPDLPGRELSDGVVALHPLGPADADDAYAAQRLPDVWSSSVPPVAPTRAQVCDSCATAQSQWLAGAAARLTIRDAPSDTYAGEIVLLYTEPVTSTGMIGYHLAPVWRGRGFATRAVRLLAGWAFDHAGLARLEAGAAVGNTASQAVLERAGFRRVGVQRSRRPGPRGARVDDVQYELVPAGAGSTVPGVQAPPARTPSAWDATAPDG
jgi:RimJ/RimL family protein N-acetyltransferase